MQALAGALAHTLCAVTGITNKSLRALMTGLPGTPYTINQASYDLTRLSRNGLITRIPHRNRYTLTPDGLKFAVFYTKVHDRILRPLMAGDQPQARPHCARHSAPSTQKSAGASTQPASRPPPDPSPPASSTNPTENSRSLSENG